MKSLTMILVAMVVLPLTVSAAGKPQPKKACLPFVQSKTVEEKVNAYLVAQGRDPSAYKIKTSLNKNQDFSVVVEKQYDPPINLTAQVICKDNVGEVNVHP